MKLWLIVIIIEISAIVIHECGHALAAWIFRFRCIGIGIGILGPYVRVFGNHRHKENAIVALAGPGANCLAGGILATFGLPITGLLVAGVGVVNLLPFPGSDGLKVIRAVLGLW
jgi:Zn-dependent protease